MIPLRTKLGIFMVMPLMFQFGLTLAFGMMLDRAEQMVVYESRSKEAIGRTTWVNTVTSNLLLAWLGMQLADSAEYREKNNVMRGKLSKTLPGMHAFFQSDKTQAGRADKLEKAARSVVGSLDSLDKEKSVDGTLKAKRFLASPILPDFWSKSLALRADLLETERASGRAAEFEDQFSMRGYLRLAMYGGLAIFVVYFIGTLLVFTGTIGKRIEELARNAERLARDEPLSAPMKGNDEIALFDETFHKMAKELKEATMRERAIIENARDVICSVSSDLRFASANKALGQFLEIEQSAIINQPLVDLVSDNDKKKMQEYFQKVRLGETVAPVELILSKAGGTDVYALWSIVWFEDLQSFFCVVHDITARKKLEQMRQEVVNMVTHDIRSPLTTVQGLIEFLSAGHLGELNERGLRMLKNADLSTDRIMCLVNDFLDAERLESGNFPMVFDDFKTASIIQDSMASVVGLAEARNVTVETSPSDLAVYCDRDRIAQVLVNLISNAIKFSTAGQTVTVEAVAVEEWAEFRVQDNGRGIPAEKVSMVFEKFKQVSESDSKNMGGSGLGLSICKSIVEQHNGQIGVNSTVGEGSTFWFRIPNSST